mgnify:CR=1 FL=1
MSVLAARNLSMESHLDSSTSRRIFSSGLAPTFAKKRNIAICLCSKASWIALNYGNKN